MRIIVSGGWSYGNIGDEAIAKATHRELCSIWPNATYIYLSYDPSDFYRHHQMMSLKSVHRLMDDASITCDISIENIQQKTEELKYSVFNAYTSLFGGNDTVFVMSGGGFFLEGRQFLARLTEIFIASSMHARICMIGQSIGPFFSGKARELATKALRLCTYISVRDISSYSLIKRLDSSIAVSCSCDIANSISRCFENPSISKKRSGQRIISVMPAVYSHRVTADERIRITKKAQKVINRITLRKYIYEIQMHRIIRYLYNREDLFIQIVMSTDWEWDRKFAHKLTKWLSGRNFLIIEEPTVDELCEHIRNSDYMISCKMHPLIIANSFGIPTIGISYNFKVDDFMKSINRQEYCFINKELNVERFIEVFNSNEDKEPIVAKSTQLSNEVKRMFNEMKSTIAKSKKD